MQAQKEDADHFLFLLMSEPFLAGREGSWCACVSASARFPFEAGYNFMFFGRECIFVQVRSSQMIELFSATMRRNAHACTHAATR
jgi:hypothetical protein